MSDEQEALTYWLDFRQRLLEHRFWSVVGCSSAQIERIQQDQGVPLPLHYRCFLSIMGQHAGGLFDGDDALYPNVLGLREMASVLLQDSTGQDLEADAVVFWAHEGYQFSYMRAGEGPNPAVYYFLEGDEAPTMVAESFTMWFELKLVDAAENERPSTRTIGNTPSRMRSPW